MPKVLESKIIFKSDDQATPNIEKGLDKLINKMKKVQREPLITDAQVSRAVQQTEKIQEQLSFSFNGPNLISGTGGGAGSHTTWGRGGGRGQPPPPTGGRPLPSGVAFKTPPPTGGPAINQRTGQPFAAFPPPGQYVDLEAFERRLAPTKDEEKQRLAEDKWERKRQENEARQQLRGQHAEEQMARSRTIRGTHMMSSMAGMVGGGPGGILGGGVGMLSNLMPMISNPWGLAALATGAVVGGGALAAVKLAQPYLQFQKQFGALKYGIPGGESALFGKLAFGAEYGYGPEETAAQLRQMQRFGGRGMEAVPAFQQMRGMGMEQENWMPFAQATAAAGGRTGEDWQRIARMVGLTIADKSNLQRIMEEMTGLVSSFTSMAGEMTQADLKQVAVMTRWGEATGSAMLTGQRGGEFWGRVGQVVAGTREPNLEMYMYDILNRSPDFRSFLAGKAGNIGPFQPIPEGRDLTGWEMRKARGRGPRAAFEVLGATTRGPGSEMEREMLLSQFGLNPNEAELFRTLYEKHGGKQEEIEKAFKEEKGISIAGAMKTDADLRRDIAKQQMDLLRAGQTTADNAIQIMNGLTKLVDGFSPAIARMSDIVATVLGEKPTVFNQDYWARDGKILGIIPWHGAIHAPTIPPSKALPRSGPGAIHPER